MYKSPENARYYWKSLQRWRVQIFIITWLAYAAFYFTRKAFSVAKLGIAEDPTFTLDKAAMANLDALYLAAYAVGQFAWGVFADRYGTRVVVLGGLVVSALAALAMGTFATLPIFASCMVIQGLAQSTGWSGLCKNIGSFFATRERGRVLGYWSTCYAFGGLVATPFAGWWAYQISHDWRMAFVSSAGVVIVVAVLFFLLQRNRPQDVGLPAVEAQVQPTGRDDVPRENYWTALRKVLANRTVLVLGMAYFLLKPARYAILMWGPVIVYERMPSIGKVASAIVPSAFEVAGLVGPILIGIVSDKLFGARRMPACVLSLMALTLWLILFVPTMQSGNIYLVVGLLFMMGVTLYGPDSMISGAAAIDFGTSESAGTATGFVNGCGSVGAILGGLLPGYFDTITVFFVFTGAALLASLLLVPFWNSRPANQAADAQPLAAPATVASR
ncbi:Regulatory protein uhpC [Pseudomonas putida]|uniref:MFS transporter n=1 Tax=Pseudomonas TaxID=286 RepID=UPI00039F0A42|nr:MULTISPECIES: MFS transporter [Pseudomonas]CAB5519380.1 Regulatory protein uhpC [Pseudomonas putida]MBH3358221.1 MFS transporter [Pseudomonas guariconensis]MCO7622065.1 MFS transporter [Pseudomonas guariconensis]MDD2089853.1 MFS transporter [Pseudomonas guariconensis]MDM9594131.1 MFS transporter [Pseudomonas guariconensis]